MNLADLLERFAGLGEVPGGAGSVEFGFARPLPLWVWALLVALAAALSWWSYHRLRIPGPARHVLALLRASTLVLLMIVLSGPQWVRHDERIEGDWLIVLLDRSASMTIPDVPAGPASTSRISRDEQLHRALRQHAQTLRKLGHNRTVLWLGFDAGAFDLPAAPGAEAGPHPPVSGDGGWSPGPADLPGPAGRRTALGQALDQALARTVGRPLSGVLIFSDGRSSDEPSRAAMRRLQSERVPVFTVPLGSPRPPADLAIERVEAPTQAFIADTVPVLVSLERVLPPGGVMPPGRVVLTEETSGQLLDVQPIPEADAAWLDDRAVVRLTTTPWTPGRHRWLVRVEPAEPDLIEDNNARELTIDLVAHPLRVLYVDGYPRWEYRYVKNLLLREDLIESACLLLAADRRYTQEGDVELASLPASPEEWAPFHVIVLGDVSPAVFSREQLEQVRQAVAVRGTGLLWIAGPAVAPAAWRDTPLGDLLPFWSVGAWEGRDPVQTFDRPVVVAPAPAAGRYALFHLGDTPDQPWVAALSDPATDWALLHYAQRIEPDQLKPTAEVLAEFIPVPGQERAPAVLTMRYGAGRVVYVATDETWRWRYGRGETLTERFWLPLIRLLGRDRLTPEHIPAVLEASPRRALVSQPISVRLRVMDESLARMLPEVIRAHARTQDGAADSDLALAPEPDQGESAGGHDRASPAGCCFVGTFLPPEPGLYRITIADPAVPASLDLHAEVDVAWPDDERRHPAADHESLAKLSEQTGGRMIAPEQLGLLADPALIPHREVRVAMRHDVRTLWDRPSVLAMLVLLLSAEWILRRLVRLP